MNEERSSIQEYEHITKFIDAMKSIAIVLVAIIGIKYISSDVIAPLLTAIFLSMIFYPLYNYFRKRNFSRLVSIIMMVFTFSVSIAGIVLLITYTFGVMADTISTQVAMFNENLSKLFTNLNIDSSTTRLATSLITEENVSAIVGKILGSVGNIFFYIFIIPLLALMIVLHIESIPNSVIENLISQKPQITHIKEISRSIMAYINARLQVNILTGLLFSVSCVLLGVPYAFLWGIIVAILSFIPYLGLVLAAIPAVMITFALYGLTSTIILIVALVVINGLAENILAPYLQGKATKISTVAIIVALIFWTWLLGPVGTILSVPLTVFIKLFLNDYEETKWLSSLVEGNYTETQVELESLSKDKTSVIGNYWKKITKSN